MQIYPKHTGPLSPDVAHSTQPADAPERAAVSPVAPTPSSSDRSDKVQISDAGRALSARGSDRATADLDPARAASVRHRILSGAYDAVQVVDAVARRILASGDL
jgi:hypothetical protein